MARGTWTDPVVLGVPRGGIGVAFEAARMLRAPLDVIVVRKLHVAHHPEINLGAVGEQDVRLIDDEVLWRTGVGADELADAVRDARSELARLADLYRGNRPRTDVRGRTAIVVDDGIRTGSTAHTACRVAHELGAAEVVLAVPVAPPQALERLEEVTDEQVCLATVGPAEPISRSYRCFPPVRDAEVSRLLRRAVQSPGAGGAPQSRDLR
ncbi:phosphoribosyltransferase [Saccharopolyspora erythraea NRRL 2338]|uniref:Phosphoribosyltransferase n=1 Tax=Saccharopolyspora erythraea (strain ATCC 11635 / DSM 40517 / JCM 4748 / NBRC 13426 / NCIMB 8594 / NRRL 2338) TaxID=405948 RepID=A4FCI4_SACEN|nr:phosphoribosyltransferase [Saccharopolyspora erythraea NRRL 2338]